LRLRIVDAMRLNRDTIMPSYYRIDGLNQVGEAWRGKPVLTAQQLRTPSPTCSPCADE